jgi:hypothetical protein
MTPAAAIAFIRRCVDEESYTVRKHFHERMAVRGLFWGDVLSVLGTPDRISSAGYDDSGRERWLVHGRSPGVPAIEILCVCEDAPPRVIFWTIYWD